MELYNSFSLSIGVFSTGFDISTFDGVEFDSLAIEKTIHTYNKTTRVNMLTYVM